MFKPEKGERYTLGVGTWSWNGKVEKDPETNKLKLVSGSVPDVPMGNKSDELPITKPNIENYKFEVIKDVKERTFADLFKGKVFK